MSESEANELLRKAEVYEHAASERADAELALFAGELRALARRCMSEPTPRSRPRRCAIA